MSNTSVPQSIKDVMAQPAQYLRDFLRAYEDSFNVGELVRAEAALAALSTPTGADAPSLASSGSLKCIECEGPVQWRCPACKISSGRAISSGVEAGTQDAASTSDRCAHHWAELYTGSRHTHWICANCDEKVPVSRPSASLAALYDELLFAVGNKYEGESRHATALRYIRQASSDAGAKDATQTQAKE